MALEFDNYKSPFPEKESKGYSVLISNFLNEPYSVLKTDFEAFKIVGFPIEFAGNARNRQGFPMPEYSRAMTDSVNSSDKILHIRDSLNQNDTALDMVTIDIQGGNTNFLFGTLIDQKEWCQPYLYSLGHEVLQRGLIASVEVALEKNKEGKDIILSSDLMTYYESIKDEIPPLNEEGIVILKVNRIKDFINIHPEYKPSPK